MSGQKNIAIILLMVVFLSFPLYMPAQKISHQPESQENSVRASYRIEIGEDKSVKVYDMQGDLVNNEASQLQREENRESTGSLQDLSGELHEVARPAKRYNR